MTTLKFMYKQIITFNFSHDEARASFEEFLEKLSFEKTEDQSTYLLPLHSRLTKSDVEAEISNWSKRECLTVEDVVRIYYCCKTVTGKIAINSFLMMYNRETNRLLKE